MDNSIIRPLIQAITSTCSGWQANRTAAIKRKAIGGRTLGPFDKPPDQ